MYERYIGGRYTLRPPRRSVLWIPAALLAMAAAAVAVTLLMALLALVVAGTFVAGGAWLAWQGTRLMLRGRAAPTRRRNGQEVRGLLEIAAANDPMEQYLLAVREYERISGAALELQPQAASRRRTLRRAAELAEQAENLSDAIGDVERRILADSRADGARAHVWELSLATRDVEHYLDELQRVRRAPTLADLRLLTSRRGALAARRAALENRLDDVQVRHQVTGHFRDL